MQPFNYSVDVANPVDSALKGYATGLQLQDVQVKRDDAERTRQQQMQLQTDLSAFTRIENPSPRDYSTLMVKYPQLSEHFKRAYDAGNEGQKQDALSRASQVYSAINANQPDVAADLLMQTAQAYRNSGRENEARAAEANAKLIQLNPKAARATAGMYLASVMGNDKFAAAFPAIGQESRAQDSAGATARTAEAGATKAEAEAKVKDIEARFEEGKLTAEQRKRELDNAYRAAEVAAAPDKFRLGNTELAGKIEKLAAETGTEIAKRGDIPEYLQKPLDAAIMDATTKTTQSNRFIDLAKRIEVMDSTGGLRTAAGAAALRAAGWEGGEEQLRGEVSNAINMGAMNALPAAMHTNFSDADRKFIAAGLPTENADPAYIASYLRSAAKLLRAQGDASRADAEWIQANRGRGSAKRDMRVDGIPVTKGTNYQDFLATYAKQKEAEYQAANSVNEAKALNRGYLRYAQPAQPVANESAGAVLP